MSDDENWDKDFGFDVDTAKLQLGLSAKPLRYKIVFLLFRCSFQQKYLIEQYFVLKN